MNSTIKTLPDILDFGRHLPIHTKRNRTITSTMRFLSSKSIIPWTFLLFTALSSSAEELTDSNFLTTEVEILGQSGKFRIFDATKDKNETDANAVTVEVDSVYEGEGDGSKQVGKHGTNTMANQDFIISDLEETTIGTLSLYNLNQKTTTTNNSHYSTSLILRRSCSIQDHTFFDPKNQRK